MSDPKRATLITVGVPKSARNKVTKTVRLTLNLDESNENKCPELNYKKLVEAEERKKKIVNGKTTGLDPFSDNDDDVERVARKFEQKYGGKSTYGKKGVSDDFADIGAGYDENDSFIDNTHGYDEMIPPECDTLYGGFYINCGSLEFKTVPENMITMSDSEPSANRRNKRRISSSSEEESSESSSESESQDEKDGKAVANGAVDSHKTEHRKKKNKKIDKIQNPKKIRRTDSSAATSGKQTSDDNVHGDGESADSRTSQSDSLTSKPAPSSENAITSDSSRDVEAKLEAKLPTAVSQLLEELEAMISRQLIDNPNTPAKEMETKTEQYIIKLERSLSECTATANVRRAVWTRAARALGVSKTKLLQRVKALSDHTHQNTESSPPSNIAQSTTATTNSTTTHSNKRKAESDAEDFDISRLTAEQKEAKIAETLQRLKALIEERKPDMMATYNAECERVQEERKKIMIASAADGAPHVEKRLPKRRFPWCQRSRALLARLKRLAGEHEAAAALLVQRALPLFPNGFVRVPTLLRQADLSKEIKAADVMRQRKTSSSQPPVTQPIQQPFPEPIQFPSSLTVTTSVKGSDKNDNASDDKDSKNKSNTVFNSIINSFNLNKDLIVEKPDEKKKDTVIVEKNKDDYIPSNSIGSITITPVPNNQPKPDKKVINNAVTVITEKQKEPLIRVKSPAALNEMAIKEKDRHKKTEKNHSHVKDKRVDTPLHIDTTYQMNKKESTTSPVNKPEQVSQKDIENMRVAENNIPRPALIPVHHSPTFAKPDKRPPEVKKKKEIVIVSDVDPLGDIQQEPVAVDDSSSDVELIEDFKNVDNSEPKRSENKSDSVPSKDKVSVRTDMNHHKVDSTKHSKDRVVLKDNKIQDGHRRSENLDDAAKEIDTVMRNLREMEHSQDTAKFVNNTYGTVITSERPTLNKMDGCNTVNG